MLLIADNLRITAPIVARAVREFDAEPLKQLTLDCVAAGAMGVDLNPGPLTRNPVAQITFLIEAVRSVCDLPLLLDTINPKAIEAGLAILKGDAIINGFSLEPAKLQTLLPLAQRYNAMIIGYLLYPNGMVPPSAEEKMQVAVALFQEFEKTGMAPEKLIIDPIVAPLIWPDGLAQNRENLTVIRNLPELLGFPVKTIAGLSNLTSGKWPSPAKRTLAQAFIPMLGRAGLNYLLMNILSPEMVSLARACDILLHHDIFACAPDLSGAGRQFPES